MTIGIILTLIIGGVAVYLAFALRTSARVVAMLSAVLRHVSADLQRKHEMLAAVEHGLKEMHDAAMRHDVDAMLEAMRLTAARIRGDSGPSEDGYAG